MKRHTDRKNSALGATVIGVLALALTLSAAYGWWWQRDVEDPGPARALEWQDLLPADYAPPEDPFATMSDERIEKLLDGSNESNAALAAIDKQMRYAPTEPSLDGQRVKIAGYVVPLDFDGQTELEEFLLVPYFGACIHTPPPPANQVVHAEADRMIRIASIYEPVWAVGILRTETVSSNLADAGYRLAVENVLPYEPDTDAP